MFALSLLIPMFVSSIWGAVGSRGSEPVTSLKAEKNSVPVEIRIEKIGLMSDIVPVGLNEKKLVEVPEKMVGWYEKSAGAGEKGKVALNGHTPGIFDGLDRLERGDRIELTDEWGEKYLYVVDEVELLLVEEFPIKKIYGKGEDKELNLVTCEGKFDTRTGTYSHRRIIYAALTLD